MASKFADDRRIDPRLKTIFAPMGDQPPPRNAASRQEILDQENSEAGMAAAAMWQTMGEAMDNETVAPSAGLVTRTEELASSPDGNTIHIPYIPPCNAQRLACVYPNPHRG